MNRSSKIFIALSLIGLLLIIISPIASLTFSALLAVGVSMYLFLKSKRLRVHKRSGLQSIKILIVLPKESKKLWRPFSFRTCSRKSEVKVRKYGLTRFTKLYVIAFMASLLVVAAILTDMPLPLLALSLLTIAPYTSILHQKLSNSMRKSRVENELPFFSLLASALSHAGQTLVKVFNVVAETKVFSALRLEALYLRKEELFASRDPITAMNIYAQRHPSRLLSSLILGYTSIIKSGGDATKYLEEKTKDLFSILKDKWNNFVNNVSIVGEAMLALFLITPLMLSMTTLVFASEVNIALYEVIIFGLIPLLSSTTLYFIHITRPYESMEYAPSKKVVILSLSSAITSIVLLILVINQSLLNAIIISSIAMVLPLSISYEREKARILKIEKELPRFLRYLGEHKKLGFPILTSIERSSNEHYNKTFSSVIKTALSRMRVGLSLHQSAIALRVRSKLCKMIFFMLDNLIETGGGSPATFEIVASYLDDYNVQRSKVRRSLYLYSVLGYLSPLMLAVCLSLTTSFMVNIGEPIDLNAMEGLLLSTSMSFQEEMNLVMFYSKLMIIVSSIAIGAILGKAVDGTLFSTKHLLICVAVALISLNLLL
ncbi:MAG: type II secretion system F family protein [Candidatus Nezhaarchaeales archaeon]